MIARIWHGATPAAKGDEYLNLMRTIAIPDYRSTAGNLGAYALRRIEGDTAHFLRVTFWESEESIRDFAGKDISVAKYYDFDKDFLLKMEPSSTHYEMYDRKSRLQRVADGDIWNQNQNVSTSFAFFRDVVFCPRL